LILSQKRFNQQSLSTLEELRGNISIIEELISIKFKENAYYYINDIVIKVKEILIYFNDIILKKVMIAFQRISDFHNGLALLHELKINNIAVYQTLKIFYAKFLIQTYNFEDALSVLDEMSVTTDVLLCRLNALQHLGMDQKAKYLIQTELPQCEKTEEYYIILRNSAHYFSYEDALNNLELVLDYFENKLFSNFTVATIKNNLGVISVWAGDYNKAKNYFMQAEHILETIKSNEIFEPFCNHSVCALLTKEYDAAMYYVDKSLEHCPRLLSLDILMLQVNKIIIKLCSSKMTIEEAISLLGKLKDDNSMIEDPWYQFHLQYNYNQLFKLVEKSTPNLSSKYIDKYYDALTKYYILETFVINKIEVQLCLGLSPNWRY
jgi:tetratricopeptide (TPR) repeat protein